MVAVLRPDRCARRLHRELPARAVEPLPLDAGEGSRAAALAIQDMRAAVRDDLLARSAEAVAGELVAHGARRQEQRRVLDHQLGGPPRVAGYAWIERGAGWGEEQGEL